MIFDLEKMRDCNAKYIFYNDDTSRKITPDMVPEILRYLTGELGYYSHLYDDFKNRYDDVSSKLTAAQALNNIYGEYKELCDCLDNTLCTYADILRDSLNKCTHYKKCLYLLTGSQW